MRGSHVAVSLHLANTIVNLRSLRHEDKINEWYSFLTLINNMEAGSQTRRQRVHACRTISLGLTARCAFRSNIRYKQEESVYSLFPALDSPFKLFRLAVTC